MGEKKLKKNANFNDLIMNIIYNTPKKKHIYQIQDINWK